jgi:hypothetical protein
MRSKDVRKRCLLLLGGTLFLLLYPCFPRAQCPEDPNDNGICDTMYVEILPEDECLVPGEQHLARFPIRVTHDVPDPIIDSIAAFVIPLCFEHTNVNARPIFEEYWNNTGLCPFPHPYNGIFRHLPNETNWMMDICWVLMGLEWDTRILDRLADPDSLTGHFRLALFPTGSADQLFPQGSKTLLATITFTLEDSTTICIDTCFWPPASRLTFVRSDGVEYIPRHNLPYCISISYLVGDCNFDGAVDAADIVYLINYLFCGGTAPPLVSGDVNCDGAINGADVVFLINYLFRDGPEPSC